MKKTFLVTVLILISMQAQLYAQSYLAKRMSMSKTESTFNINNGLINLRDFVVLKEGRMILDLSDLHDYESFRNLDSVLTNVSRDITFYKDSLAADRTSNYRIDYVVNENYSFKKIRFKKYKQDGNIFMNQDGEISKLKFEQDTINIIFQKSKPGLGNRITPCMIPYSIKATFILGNYSDIDKIVAGRVLGPIIDTLEKASQFKQVSKNVYSNPLSIVYNPYFSGKGKMQIYHSLMNNEYDTYTSRPKKRHYISANANIGVGFVRSTFAPMVDLGIQYNKHWSSDHHSLLRLSATGYYFFDKDIQGNFLMNDNWFINGDIGSIYDKEMFPPEWIGKKCTFGLGYLVINKGGYFKNNTFKIFTDIQFRAGFQIVPELIITNNFKQVFPGFTLKVF